ncbi:Heme-degrading monooxygenase HmoA [Solimonas aquatica]|uniref:Heme-degrading monooxygenase HmoA n=1 Tax=Solimonas aquatica TaxID=489703 RepID=A0A1H9HXD8_9GAMM|nr:antibiotic biosynthesis monooxygenase [Solimonas aquatica]SEQ66865.1 Heme-degrading monooxygenase HmoA [Solimonas aquatica]
MDKAFPRTPAPPYYAVIFSSRRSAVEAGYEDMALRMAELAQQQPGFLGMESARDAQGFGITVSYWQTLEDITAWRRHAEHRLAQQTGRRDWYRHYELRVARVERAYNKPD